MNIEQAIKQIEKEKPFDGKVSLGMRNDTWQSGYWIGLDKAIKIIKEEIDNTIKGEQK